MRICLVGKFPPIQGGVSMRSYWTAHRLAERGHDVHVVTNAMEVRPPYRMHMRAEDWARCECDYGAGRVTVHWTDPVDRAQRYVPMASAFVSKLAGVAARAHAAHPFDVVFSHDLEPYGVAGHLAAEMTGAPHVVRMAGSDAGRLWHHPQLEALYDHVLRSAHVVLAVGAVAQRAAARGVDPARLVPGGGFAVPEALFAPDGPALDLAALRDEIADAALVEPMWGGGVPYPYVGVYGKLGESKGSFALLAALHRLQRSGRDLGLVAMAHGLADVERRFRDEARALGLEDRILQIPFLPHWRVPEFLRGCLAVGCLEQDFPIAVHNPVVPREVLLSGTCLIGTTEILNKLPAPERLVHGYNCIAVRNVNDITELAAALAAAFDDPARSTAIGNRGRVVAQEMQRDANFPDRLEKILDAASRGAPVAAREETPADQRAALRALAAFRAAVGPPHAVAEGAAHGFDTLFRLQSSRPMVAAQDTAALVPFRDPCARIAAIDGSMVVVFDGALNESRNPLVMDAETARILELCDGYRTVLDVARSIGDENGDVLARRIAWIKRLFELGLIGLRDGMASGTPSP